MSLIGSIFLALYLMGVGFVLGWSAHRDLRALRACALCGSLVSGGHHEWVECERAQAKSVVPAGTTRMEEAEA